MINHSISQHGVTIYGSPTVAELQELLTALESANPAHKTLPVLLSPCPGGRGALLECMAEDRRQLVIRMILEQLAPEKQKGASTVLGAMPLEKLEECLQMLKTESLTL